MKYTKELHEKMFVEYQKVGIKIGIPDDENEVLIVLKELDRLQSLNRWHKYPDEKPEKDGYYWIIDDMGDQTSWMFRRGEWYLEWYPKEFVKRVTHWRPLPQPEEQE